jgi:outer membrane immunogenic protein
VAGGHAGYNWEFGSVVSGLEGDLSATGVKGSSDTFVVLFASGSMTSVAHNDVKYVGTVRGRLGIATEALGSGFMFYGTAGAAWERVDQSGNAQNGPPVTFSNSFVRPTNLLGWVAGVGAEAKLLGSNWIGRLEYLHYDFGSAHTATGVTNAGVAGFTNFVDSPGTQTMDVVRAGLAYKFGADAVLARY